jgi:hypothetical protein
LNYTVRLDPLAAFFSLILSVLAACVAVYPLVHLSLGIQLRNPQRSRIVLRLSQPASPSADSGFQRF